MSILSSKFRPLLTLITLALGGHTMAQGLHDPSGFGLTPPTSVATADEASAVLVNPAGVGFATGPELLYLHSSSYGSQRSDVDSLFAAVTLLDTLGFGVGAEIARPFGSNSPTGGLPYVRGSMTYALKLDSTMSIGGSYRVLSAQGEHLAAAQMWDAGIMLRPFRFMSAGVVVENMIPPEMDKGPLIPRAYRLGFGIRPNAEWATLGVEARINEQLRVDPAVVLRLEPFDGIIASVQFATRDLTAGFDDSTVGIGLEINHSHVGAGATAATSMSPGFAGFTGYARASLASYPSVFPRMSRTVKIVLAGDLRPLPPDDPVEAAAYGSSDSPGEIALALTRAERDSSVDAVLLEIRPLAVGFAQIQAMRRRILALRAEKKKKVFAILERASDREYFLASAADVIIMPPSGTFAVDGIGVVSQYYAGTLHHIGIKAHAVTTGPYKTAPETFTRSQPSASSIESNSRLNDVLSSVMVKAVAKSRQLEPDEVKKLIDRGHMTTAEARQAGLIDYLGYADEIEKIIEKELGSSPFIDDEYLRPVVHRTHWAGLPSVAIVPITSVITMGRSTNGFLGMGGSTGAEDIVAAIQAATENSDVVAIVLRVDSPGGDALASDLIWRAVEIAQKKKPVVASFGDVAASGGYYVACGAEVIFAERTTISGSIGVYSMFFTGQELLETLDVGTYEDSRGLLANALSPHREPTEEELEMIRRSVNSTYELFKKRVAQGRKLKLSEVEKIAQGRVWSGADALRNRLVDKVGGLTEAIAWARQRAGLNADTDIEISVYQSGGDPISQWRSAVEGAVHTLSPQQPGLVTQLAAPLELTAQWVALANQGHTLALLPYHLEFQ